MVILMVVSDIKDEFAVGMWVDHLAFYSKSVEGNDTQIFETFVIRGS